MTFRYSGSVAVVTGASSGLGRALAAGVAGRGATVVAVARRGDALDALADEVRSAGGDLTPRVCDVTDAERWPGVLADLEREHGRIDLLVNAAGIERRKGVESVEWDDVERTMAVNFAAAAHATLAVLEGMRARGHGAVVNVSSDHGRAPGPGTPAYCASKAALSAFTESLAHELASTDVHLHLLYPGWVPTPLGQGAVDEGMPLPPRAVRRTEAQVVGRTLAAIGGPDIEINAARLATLAPVVRALAPSLYRRSMQRAGGT